MRRLCVFWVSVLSLLMMSASVSSQVTGEKKAASLDELLGRVRAEHDRERNLYRQRETEFVQAHNQQQQLLDKARAEYYLAQARNNPDRQKAQANADEITRLKQELDKSVLDMGDVYSVHRQFATDFAAVLDDSLIGAQFPQRSAQLKSLNAADTLPTIEDMETLWFLVQQEMTESGKVVRYPGKIVSADGSARAADVVRVGNFTALHDDVFLRYVPETSELVAPRRQPDRHFTQMASGFAATKTGLALVPVDPTRGNLLGMLARTPDIVERIHQGGIVGYLTIGVGVLGVCITLYRCAYLLLVRRGVLAQLRHAMQPSGGNPLGRILLSVQAVHADDEETIQYTLDEAILREIPRLEYGHSVIKLFAAIGPMLGLLGTVTGMIKTFEAISLFGGGDPKLMAAGISEALVCTVLGLLVAVPLLFGHNVVTALAKDLIQRLDEQSASILARSMNKTRFAREKNA
jgi:biopolymer transport protein ExbB